MAILKPRAPVRRFDVFAEYKRLEAIKEDGLTAPKAKGYGLWVAKVVAAQKFGRLKKPKAEERKEKTEAEKRAEKKKWHELSGIAQTDKLFDKEIVNRMGKDFYAKVFSPAIKKSFNEGKEYREIRDAIRQDWKPEK